MYQGGKKRWIVNAVWPLLRPVRAHLVASKESQRLFEPIMLPILNKKCGKLATKKYHRPQPRHRRRFSSHNEFIGPEWGFKMGQKRRADCRRTTERVDCCVLTAIGNRAIDIINHGRYESAHRHEICRHCSILDWVCNCLAVEQFVGLASFDGFGQQKRHQRSKETELSPFMYPTGSNEKWIQQRDEQNRPLCPLYRIDEPPC